MSRRLYCSIVGCAVFIVGVVWLVFAAVRSYNLSQLEQLESAYPELSADSCLLRLNDLSKVSLSEEGQALHNMLQSACLFEKGRWAEADSLSKLALRYFDFYTWDSARIARISVLRGCIKREQRNWLEATDAFIDAKEYGACMKNDATFNYWVNLHLASIYQKNDLPEQAFVCLEDALSCAYQLGETGFLCESMAQLALHYLSVGDYRTALAYHDTLLHHLPLSECRQRRRCLEGMAYIQLHLNDTQRARALLDSAAACGDTLSSRWHVLRGRIFEQEGCPDSAAACFRQVLHARSMHHAILGYEGLFRLTSHTGDYSGATQWARELLAVKDSFNQLQKEQWADQLQILHDYRHSRKKAQSEKYRMVVHENHLFRALVVSLLATGVFISIWLYNRKRRLKAENRLLQEQAVREQEKREQEALRLDYYKRLNMLTLPLAYENLRDRKIHIGEKEWKAIYENTDACFIGFTGHLRRRFPQLKEDDIRLCCLLKMELPLELIALIFGIEKASVSQRKQRLRQKMELGMSLDEFLLNFQVT